MTATSQRRIWVCGILLVFALLFALLSIGNHLCFRTYGLDLGLYTKTLYDHAHLHVNDGSFFLWETSNQLGGHFDLYLILLSPLVYLMGNYTLLVVQILALLMGMWGMYRLTRHYCGGLLLPLLSMLLLGCSFGVWHALSFDYHSNVVSAMLLPWLLWFAARGHWRGMVLMAALMAIAKETSALWVVFILLALWWDHRREPVMRRAILLTAVGSMAYFLMLTLWVMPALGGGGGTGFWRYQWMGADVASVVRWILTHPLQALADLFVDFTADGDCGNLKVEFFACIAASGLLLTCAKPNYLLMIIPPLTMKMLSCDTYAFWGIAHHYNIEICTVAAVGSVAALHRIPSARWRMGTAVAATVLTLSALYHTVSHPVTPIRKANVRLISSKHYRQTDFSTATARRLLRQIPGDASVCATTMFTPHLAARDSVYVFPVGLAWDAEYWLLLRHHWCYYEGEEEEVAKIIDDTVHYRVVDHDENLYLVRRCAQCAD